MSVRQFWFLYFLSGLGLGLTYLAVTGRLHWLFVLIGGLMPFMSVYLKRFAGSGFSQQQAGQTSRIKTRYLNMSLDHDSGKLDGQILLGQFTGLSLSQLDFSQTMEFFNECQSDTDSVNVLRAYLERAYPDWEKDKTSGPERASTLDGEMDQMQALAILGLDSHATKDEIVTAHRRLIQKMHPDHGGSTYLAARINEAKTVLIKSKESK